AAGSAGAKCSSSASSSSSPLSAG
ncbi:hypothetical protein Tco_0076702, partial [Tanacetum coccineum]